MAYIHICALGFISRKRKALIPWAKLTVDLTAWIDKECYPPDFKWADLSKNQISDVFQLFDHWRHQRQSGLAPIIWNSSCDILADIERPIQRIWSWGVAFPLDTDLTWILDECNINEYG
jgi:hypothetical protein